MDSPIGAETDQMEGLAAGHQAIGQSIQFMVGVEAAVAHGLADPNQFLTDHTASADGEMPNFGVAHLIVGQANIGAAGFNQGVGIGMPKGIHHWGLGGPNGVVGIVVAITPAIQDAQNNRSN